jgi:hypothetical protein
VLLEVEKGIDPAAAKLEERRREADLFQSVIDEFVERHAKPNNRGWQRQDRDLRREFLPHWRTRPISRQAMPSIKLTALAVANAKPPLRGRVE